MRLRVALIRGERDIKRENKRMQVKGSILRGEIMERKADLLLFGSVKETQKEERNVFLQIWENVMLFSVYIYNNIKRLYIIMTIII